MNMNWLRQLPPSQDKGLRRKDMPPTQRLEQGHNRITIREPVSILTTADGKKNPALHSL